MKTWRQFKTALQMNASSLCASHITFKRTPKFGQEYMPCHSLRKGLSMLLILVLLLGLFPSTEFEAKALEYDNYTYNLIVPNGITGQDIVDEARGWTSKGIGSAYYDSPAWGTNGEGVALRSGYNSFVGKSGLSFDCSGFVSRVLNDVGFRGNVDNGGYCVYKEKYGNYISSDMCVMFRYGKSLDDIMVKVNEGDYSDLQPGDILGWCHIHDGGGSSSHIVIYAGAGKMVEFTGSGYKDRNISGSGYTFERGARYVSKQSDSPSPARIGYENCTYKVIKSFTFKDDMYGAANSVGDPVPVGSYITVREVWKNKYGNMWVRTADNKWVYAGWKYESGSWCQDGDQYLQFYSDNNKVAWDDNNLDGQIVTYGQPYTLTGHITSDASLVSVKGEFTKDSACWGNPTSEFGAYGTSYDVPNSDLDHALSFASLPESSELGLEITVKYRYNRGFQVGSKTIKCAFSNVQGSSPTEYLLDPIVFNLDYYLEANPDVKAMNWSADVVQNHWLQNGISEGRAASPAFNVAYYVNQNADLQGYSGNYAGAIEHYCTNGVYESRPTSSLFNIAQYKENYPDLAESLSDDDYEITYHYVGAGYKEGRIANRPLMVYFNGNGGSVTTGSKAIQKSRKYGILPTPTRSGFSFDGWYTAASGGTRVTEDTIHDSIHELTLYAHWSKRMVTGIALSPTAISLNVGDAQTLSVSVVPSDAYDRSVTWSTTNSAVATVSSGRITAVGAGMATIICTANDGSGVTARCTVTVSDSHAHTLVMIAPIPASSTENGKSIGLRCSDCNEIMLQQTVIDAGWVLALPKGLQCVEEEAFTGADMEQINVPEGMTEIKARAFADCKSLMLVTIPDSVTTIAESAFSGCNETYFCIVADAGSAAAKYAKNHGYQLWSPGTSYTVHFDLNGASGSIADIVVENGAPLGTLPTAVRDYFSFDGWYTEPVYGSRVSAETIYDNRTETLTLYARWTENAYSDWVTEAFVPAGARIADTKTQYRYRDTTYSTVYSSWSAWGDWTTTRETISDLKKEEAATVYGWYWFQCPNCGAHWHVWSGLAIDCSPTWGPGGGCGNDNIQSTDGHIVWNTTPWSGGTANWCGTGKICLGSDIKTRMFAWTDGGSAREGYRYATRTSSQQASVGAWSSWSDTAVSSSSTREVETRRLVRYQAK